MKSCKFFILTVCIIIILIIIYNVKYNSQLFNYDSFISMNNNLTNTPTNTNTTTTTKYITNDGTKLYGSLFLDNLNEVIINMTDPPINYNSKRVELNKYSDVLL